MSSGSKTPIVPSGEQLRAAFDVAFGAAAIPDLHEDAVNIAGPATMSTLFDSTAKMVLEATRAEPTLHPVDSRHAALYEQATASLGALLESWLDWFNKPLEDSQGAKAAQSQNIVAANINWSGGPPMDREEAFVERLRAEGKTATQRDLDDEFGEPYLDSMADRRGLTATCEVLDALLQDHASDGYRAACDLGLAAGKLLEALVGARDGEFAREVGRRGRMLAELATVLGSETAEIVKEAADGSVVAFREERWRRDEEDVFWSDVVLTARQRLQSHGGPARAGPVTVPSLKRTGDPRELPRLSQEPEEANCQAATGRVPSLTMEQIEREIQRVAPTDDAILLTGDTGTGKDYYAMRIHCESRKEDGKLGGGKGFVTVNCAGLSAKLFQDELFGHVKGAYSGAAGAKEGLVVAAENGTLYLNEVGELSSTLQAALLGLIEYRRYHVLGSKEPDKPCSCRFILATNVDVHEAIEDGTFRRDLYERMSRHYHLRPLKGRKHEIPGLLKEFLKQWEEARRVSKLTPRGRKAHRTDGQRLMTGAVCNAVRDSGYDWPGNVRQLRRAAIRVLDDSKPWSRKYVTADAILAAAKRQPAQ